ncbi:MAG: ClbS/DfsB family four-helix bundle protein [Chloroflexi bacterium]|nr:ClbS/DfsB family four-helix bundle protein [Chloroflexota bacterium]
MNRSSLLAALADGRARLEQALAALSAEQMLERVDGDWTRKDVVAHLEAWERRVVDLLAALRSGHPPTDRGDTDAMNAGFHAASRDRSLDDVRAGERDAYGAMITAIEGASDEELFDGGHFGWTEGDPLAEWFRGNGDEHVDEHLAQLRAP